MKSVFSLRLLLLTSGVILLLAGCDATTEDTVTLTQSGQDALEFNFQFSGDNLQTNQQERLVAQGTLDLTRYLEDNGGFAKDEILSARLESAELFITSPLKENLDFLNRAILQLSIGDNSTDVAEKDQFKEDDEVQMSVNDRELDSFLRAPEAQVILRVNAQELQDDDYEMSVLLRFRIELEGV